MHCLCFLSALLPSYQLVVARRLLPLAQARQPAAYLRQHHRLHHRLLSFLRRRQRLRQLEQPASASGPDLSSQINSNTGASQTGIVFYRFTINGRDAYAAHDPTNIAVTDQYCFPCSSYSDAQTLQASLVNLFTAHGFTVSSVSQNVWGPDSILTALSNGRISISASNSATVRPDTNMLNSGSEVDVIICSLTS
jgi:hypothetical protein